MLLPRESCSVEFEESVTEPLPTVRPAAFPAEGSTSAGFAELELVAVIDAALMKPLPASVAVFPTVTAPGVVTEPVTVSPVAVVPPLPTDTLLVPEIDPLATIVPAVMFVAPV